jgi:hypothetical protein
MNFLKSVLIIGMLSAGACGIQHEIGFTSPKVAPQLAVGSPLEKPAYTNAQLRSIYYSDLGPGTIDVSNYPAQQKANYVIFTQVCSQCHTLARAINSPITSRTGWDYYVIKMRLRSRFKAGAGYNEDQAQAIVDFLTYDSQQRKIAHQEDFDVQTLILQRKFDETISERMRRLQLQLPPIMTDGQRQ